MKKLISTLLIGLFILSLILIGKNIFQRQASENLVTDIRDIRNTIEEQNLREDMKGKVHGQDNLSQNPVEEEIEEFKPEITIGLNQNAPLMASIENYVGWVAINNTRIDYPVVKYEDNDFYLNHGYDMKENVAGAIFMDRRNLGNVFDNHTILYGHYMKNGTMFTDLNLYLEADFFKENPLIQFKDLYKTYEYEVIAAYYVSADDYVLPYDLDENILEGMLAKSLFETNYTYQPSDRFLTLSTCNYILDNGRMILHAVMK